MVSGEICEPPPPVLPLDADEAEELEERSNGFAEPCLRPVDFADDDFEEVSA